MIRDEVYLSHISSRCRNSMRIPGGVSKSEFFAKAVSQFFCKDI